MAPGSKALALVEDNSSSRSVGWRRFVGLWCLLENFGNILGVWRTRCSQPDGDVEEHRSLGGSLISRLDNGAFVGLIYELLVLS